MRVIVGCEFSGIVREAFKKQGWDAWSCDLEDTEIPGQHIKGDVLDILDDNWDLGIFHPPCTYLSNAGACRLYPQKGIINEERFKKGLEAKVFFMKLYNCKIKRICVENPVPSRIFELPLHTQEIQPWQFGHPYTKKTRLWLKNLPLLEPTNIISPIGPYVPSGTSRKNRDKYGIAKRGNDSKERSRFWNNIADAMAEQWTVYFKEEK